MPRFIGRDEVRRLMDEGAQLVEVLEPSQYRAAHLPGAVNMPGWELDRERASQLDKDRPVIVYCLDTQ